MYTFKVEIQTTCFFFVMLMTTGAITRELYKYLYICFSAQGLLYGLPKTHKPDFENL